MKPINGSKSKRKRKTKMNNQTMLRDSGMKMKTRVKAGATKKAV